ncbi:MAG: DegT/DnrJ/EryC1/StrS family aminotransferase [Anaerolineales bacterium]|nr:DegT/DnrJ/EryC1/StrS family aminotransferase [Anaerolineales bacterium]
MNWRVPLSDIDFGAEEEEAVQQVVKSRWLTMGAVTREFEEEFAAYVGARHAIAVTNATAALHLACVAGGLGAGDEAILPSLTFVATANAVRYAGAIPVFADIAGENDLNISPRSIEACITPRTRAILVVHYGGYACDMPAILSLAEEHGLVVIEDAAHAIGSELEGRMLGTWGQIGCYSFFSNKNMTTGEGGMLVTDDDELAERLRLLRSHGMTSLTWDRHKGHAWSYDVVDLGYNYRIDEIRSSLGREQLKKLPRNNRLRREKTALYRQLLAELSPEIVVPFEEHPGVSACHLLPILLPDGTPRESFMENMKAQGIQTSIHYPPIHRFSAYRDLNPPGAANLPQTESAATREVTLPLYPALSEDDIRFVAKAVQTSLAGVARALA